MPHTKITKYGEFMRVKELEFKPGNHGADPSKNKKRNRRRNGRTQRYRRLDNLRQLEERFTCLVGANFRATEPPALITLTMLEIVGISKAYRAFTDFIRRLRARAGKNIRHIGVPEFQGRGAVHFHVLVWGLSKEFYDDSTKGEATEKNDLRESNDRRVQNLWQRGFADCISTDGSPKLAGYLAKYMRKAMHDERLLRQKAYTASRNVMRPVSQTLNEEFDATSDYFLEGYDPEPLYDEKYKTDWFGKGRSRLYKKK